MRRLYLPLTLIMASVLGAAAAHRFDGVDPRSGSLNYDAHGVAMFSLRAGLLP